jgi:purine-nucleoside phosphorylase
MMTQTVFSNSAVISFLETALPCAPDAVVVLGSGQGAFADASEKLFEIRSADIPGFPHSDVPGHEGKIVLARMSEKHVLLFQGRVHPYEGVSMQDTALPAFIAAAFHVKVFILTNAAGGLNPLFGVGDLMLITDYIISPLAPSMGASFRSFYDGDPKRLPVIRKETISKVISLAVEQRIALREGVYAMVSGPSYETRAEIHFLRRLGADAVGMSSIPELIVAHRTGIEVIGISCITNQAKTVPRPVSHIEVTNTAEAAAEKLSGLLTAIIENF